MTELLLIGDTYINSEKLSGVSDVQRTEVPGEGASSSYSFTIYLEGSEASVIYTDGRQAKRQHERLADSIPPVVRFSSGGYSLNVNYVNAIGPVIGEMTRNDVDFFVFPVQMDGATVNLQYREEDQAQAARAELVALFNRR